MKFPYRIIFYFFLFFIILHYSLITAEPKPEIFSKQTTLPDLPKPISNNAVASLSYNGVSYIATFNGLTASKTVETISSEAFLWDSISTQWKQLPSVPGKGKLASSAIAIDDTFYVIGGYTVATDGSEISTPQIYSLKYPFKKYHLETHMPVPVDDAVALVYKQRYMYLISGWHDVGNVSRVQIYDTKLKQWSQGSSFPGVPVFGHTAAILDNQIILIDGVGVVAKINGKRQFAAIQQTWLGVIDRKNPTRLNWKKIKNHPGKAGYRMAAFAQAEQHRLVFVGGSDNPYNYNGIGYDGVPSNPIQKYQVFDLKKNCWLESVHSETSVMDLRGVVRTDQGIWTVGGMSEKQKVLKKISRLEIKHSKFLECIVSK